MLFVFSKQCRIDSVGYLRTYIKSICFIEKTVYSYTHEINFIDWLIVVNYCLLIQIYLVIHSVTLKHGRLCMTVITSILYHNHQDIKLNIHYMNRVTMLTHKSHLVGCILNIQCSYIYHESVYICM